MSAQVDSSAITNLILGLLFGQLLLFIPIIAIGKLGGPKIAFYRALKISWMSIGILDHDGSRKWYPIKMTDIKTLSPPHIEFKGRTRYIDNTNFTRRFGAPAQEWHIDNSLPLPIIRGFRDVILDPITVTKAYNTDILRRFYNLSKEANKKVKSNAPMYILMALACLLAVLGAVWLAVR